MMRREREGRSRARRVHVFCLNVSIETHSSQLVMKLRFVAL